MLRNPAFWIVLFLVIVLLFGANKLPGLASGVGRSLKIFKREVSDLTDEDDKKQPQDEGQATIDYNSSTVSEPQVDRGAQQNAEHPR